MFIVRGVYRTYYYLNKIFSCLLFMKLKDSLRQVKSTILKTSKIRIITKLKK